MKPSLSIKSGVDILYDDFIHPENSFKEMSSCVMESHLFKMKNSVLRYLTSQKLFDNQRENKNVNSFLLGLGFSLGMLGTQLAFLFTFFYNMYGGDFLTVASYTFAGFIGLLYLLFIAHLTKIGIYCYGLKKYALKIKEPLTVINTFSILVNSKYSTVTVSQKDYVFKTLMDCLEKNNVKEISSLYDEMLYSIFSSFIKSKKDFMMDNSFNSNLENKKKLFSSLFEKIEK